MLSTKAIRRKIRTVKNIQKITDAMRMVAAAKLQRVQAKVAAGRPYADKMSELLHRVAPHAANVEHPLLEVRDPVEHIAVIVMAGNRGLCGSFNSNVLRRAERHLETLEAPSQVISVGRKAGDFMVRRGHEVLRRFDGLSAESPLSDVQELAWMVRDAYESGQVDRVDIIYTEFVSAVEQRPKTLQFLPFQTSSSENVHAADVEYIFEPDAGALMMALLPRYVDTLIYHLVLESTASEHGARMMAMTNASDNASEVMDNLTLRYNRARQQSITTELLEVVGGANALEQSV